MGFIVPGIPSSDQQAAQVLPGAHADQQAVIRRKLKAGDGCLVGSVKFLGREVSQEVARAVARQAHQDGVAGRSLNEAIAAIEGERWTSAYRTCVAV